MSVFHNNALIGASGQGGAGPAVYSIERSLRFNSADSAYLSRTPASAGNRKTWTWAGWVKLGKPSNSGVLFDAGAANTDTASLFVRDTGVLQFYAETNPFEQATIQTSQVLRDYSAWYHIVLVVDTTQSTGSNRIKFYLNGSQITAFAIASYPSQNADFQINATLLHTIGKGAQYLTNFIFDGLLADIHFIDGQALDPSSFGEFDTNGVWQPIAYAGSYGTNGFHLPFSDNSTAAALGTDTSGNGNTWTVNNLSVTAGAGNDSLVDSPTNYGTDTGAGGEVRGNYATLNPLDKGSNITLTNGNLDVSCSSSWNTVRGTIGVSSGKWYWEYTMTAAGYTELGIGTSVVSLSTYPGSSASAYIYYSPNGNKANSNSFSSYGNSYTTGDVVGVAIDLDSGKIWFAKNGTWQASGDPAAGTNAAYTSIPSATYFPIFGLDNTGGTVSGALNAGARPFAYTAPSGFKALCTTNLAEPTIADGSTVMDVITWSGSGGARSFTGLNFSPDLVWNKQRNGANSHQIYDIVRGAGNNNDLASDLTAAEGSATTSADVYGYLSSFDSTGFSVANGTDGTFGAGYWNQSGRTYVAWTWDAGSSTVSNTGGSITSQVRANASAGFSVVTYTGTGANATVGHGLGVAPSMVIIKSRSFSQVWVVGHSSIGFGNYLLLNTTDASAAGSNVFNSTAPTSTVFSLGTGSGGNQSAATYVSYCFAPVDGYSSAFSYTGNGSSDGPFCFLGFRPRFIIQKRTDSAGSWLLIDTARDPVNVARNEMFANSSAAEYDNGSLLDVLSNGFKIRATFANMNASGGSYIGFAFAEHPFSISRAR